MVGPGRDQARHIGCVAGLAEKMVRAGKRDETFRMVSRRKDVVGILDIHRVVDWRVENEQRLLQGFEMIFQILPFDILKKCTANPEEPAGQLYFHFVFVANLHDLFAEQANHVRRIERRAERHNGSHFGDPVSGDEHGSATETVTDQERRRRDRPAQVIGRRDQIFDIRGERRVGKFPFARAEPGEVETEHANAGELQSIRDTPRRPVALAAGKAMREEGDRANGAVRPVE